MYWMKILKEKAADNADCSWKWSVRNADKKLRYKL